MYGEPKTAARRLLQRWHREETRWPSAGLSRRSRHRLGARSMWGSRKGTWMLGRRRPAAVESQGLAAAPCMSCHGYCGRRARRTFVHAARRGFTARSDSAARGRDSDGGVSCSRPPSSVSSLRRRAQPSRNSRVKAGDARGVEELRLAALAVGVAAAAAHAGDWVPNEHLVLQQAWLACPGVSVAVVEACARAGRTPCVERDRGI
jgi:hypothetical protein